MGKHLESFRIRLKDAFDSGRITQAELHRKTGISGSMINRYLKGSEPGLYSIELIASALECDPRELIKPENEPIVRPHALQDCLDVVNRAATGQYPRVLDDINKDKAGSTTFDANRYKKQEIEELIRKLLNQMGDDFLVLSTEDKALLSEIIRDFVLGSAGHKFQLGLAARALRGAFSGKNG